MCGRTSLFIPEPELQTRFDAELVADGGYTPRFNIAPGDGVEVITAESADEIDRFHWGLVPKWMDDPEDGFINARSETVESKRSFQSAWQKRPCLVLSSGFYEWKNGAGPKQPYRIHREDDPAFALAGIWEEWETDNTSLRTVSILTTEPNDLIEPIHDRMPVILPPEDEANWLEWGPEERKRLCQPYPGDDLDAYQIPKRVNNPANDDARVIEPLETDQSSLGEFA